jgi:Heparinase II/III-like protein/Heparinase II/III N-terminus
VKLDDSRRLKRLRKDGLDGLRVRGTQAVAALAERRGWSSLAILPTDSSLLNLLDRADTFRPRTVEELRAHFQTRERPMFFGGFADRGATIAALRSSWPEAEGLIMQDADRILAGRFDLLGIRDLSFGDPINWQHEPVADKRAPSHHWSRLNYLDAAVTGDPKIVWELNRHQHFATLGQAYWLSGEDRYAGGFTAHLASWMDQNPPKYGINWTSSLEVALRAISWLWALEFFKDASALTSTVFVRALKFLYLSARHIETYLSTYFSPNTHLTGEALGLFYLGILLPEFRSAARWRATGIRILLEQLDRQIYPDGVYFEQSSYYQRYTTDFYTHLLVLLLANGEAFSNEVPARVAAKLKGSLDHLMYLTRPDGTTPLFGDDDGGRLVMLDHLPANDFRATLSTGAALFQRNDYKYVAGQPARETLWLLGPTGVDEFNRLQGAAPDKKSASFIDGGYYVMRDGWSAEANYMLLDCGPHGFDGCGHAHADALAVDLAARGRTMLVDPGTYAYTASQQCRDWFRSSPAHNTLTVDGASSSVPAGPFSWATRARCERQAWLSCERFDYFEGKHDGYQRLDVPAIHTRGVLFVKHDYWVMRDRVGSAGPHRYDLWFHFEVGATPDLEALDQLAASVSETNGIAGLKISCLAGKGAWRREEAPVSHCYGQKVLAPVYVLSATATGSHDFVTFLFPQGASTSAPSLREVEAIGGRAFEVLGDDSHDIVIIRTCSGAGRSGLARLASDFDWTWARFADEHSTTPDELVLIDGHSLALDGKEVLRSRRRISHLVAQRVGDRFRIETGDGIIELQFPIPDLDAAFGQRYSCQQLTAGNE